MERLQPEDMVEYLGTTPTPSQLPPRGERLWIDRSEQLLHAVNVLKQATVIAIDAEFTQARSRDALAATPRLALLQLAIDSSCFVVDTLRLHDLSPLIAVLENPDSVILLHGAGADLHVMAARDLQVVHYYDLEATCRSIFGQRESSLAAMLQRAFNIRLDKSLQRTDWTRRPLPSAMIAYAARDAEVTLALYYWLDQHYPDILQLHECSNQPDLVASWIEPFLRGGVSVSPDAVVTEARIQGVITSQTQIYIDCQAALQAVKHPMRRCRLLRLIADLSLVQMAPDIQPLLQAATSDERASSVRALGRLGVKSAQELIRPLLQDPVQDVRKTAQIALQSLAGNQQPEQRATTSTKSADGSHTWIVESESATSSDEEGWKARLRSMIE